MFGYRAQNLHCVVWQAIRGPEPRAADCYLLLSAPVETRLQLHLPKLHETGKHWLHFNPSVFMRLTTCQFLIAMSLGCMSAKAYEKGTVTSEMQIHIAILRLRKREVYSDSYSPQDLPGTL